MHGMVEDRVELDAVGQNVIWTHRFKSMLNFRRLISTRIPDDISEEGRSMGSRPLNLFRSSRPDHLTAEEVDMFVQLNIRSVIDLRSASEYRKSDGAKLLDAVYPAYKVKLPFKLHAGDKVTSVPVISQRSDQNSYVRKDDRKHYLINFLAVSYVWALLTRATWYFCLYSFIVLLVDLLLWNGFINFKRLFMRHIVSKGGLAGYYIDLLTYGQVPLYSALKLLCDPENLPAMVNCRAGKDRTGIVIALALWCVGWSKDDIVADYAQSQVELESVRHLIYEEMVTQYHMCESFTTAHADTMRTVLDYVEDRYGSVEQYLESIGLTRHDQQQLRKNLVCER